LEEIIINNLKHNNMKKFARKCSITGEGMNEGFVIGDGDFYIKYEKDLITFLRDNNEFPRENESLSDDFIMDEAYNLGEYYYTEWEDEDDYEYYEDENGNIIEI
jgi:hypothetical protein